MRNWPLLKCNSAPTIRGLLPGVLGLGIRAQEAADHEEASRAWGQALTVIRANEGLYSLNQLPILQRLVEVRGKLGDWHGVESAYALMRWLYRRNFSADDPRLLRGLIRLRQWHLGAYNKDTRATLAAHMDEADRLHAQAAAIVRSCTGDPRAAACLLDGRGCEAGADRHHLNSVAPDGSK